MRVTFRPFLLALALGAPAASAATPVMADFDRDGRVDLARLAVGQIELLAGRDGRPVVDAGQLAARLEGQPVRLRLPVRADLLAAGDFDADGDADLLTARLGEARLTLHPGDGRGGFGQAVQRALPGPLSALASGEVDRPDGIPEVLVGIEDRAGAAVLLWKDARGAWSAVEERWAMPARVASLAIGWLDEDSRGDWLALSGERLVVGRGRSPDATGTPVQAGQPVPAGTTAVAIGAWVGKRGNDIALRHAGGIEVWGSPDSRRALEVRSRGKASPTEADFEAAAKARSQRGGMRAPIELADWQPTPAPKLAASWPPQRLQSRGKATRASLVSARDRLRATRATFTVTSTSDSGPGSLREALSLANNSPGLDLITFNIAGPGPHVINLTSNILSISDAVAIDGYTQPGAIPNSLAVGSNAVIQIQINAVNLAGPLFELAFHSGSLIRGLAIHQPFGPGISLFANANDMIIEGNYIGLDASGATVVGNGGAGIEIYNFSSNNRIGTDGDGINDLGERNVIAGNNGGAPPFQANIHILNGANANVIAGNYIGLSAAGTSLGLSGGIRGILIGGGNTINPVIGTRIGGNLPVERNLISGQSLVGIEVIDAEDTLIQGNWIGLNAAGNAAVPNADAGVFLLGHADTLPVVGGTVVGTDLDGIGDANEGNVISGNTGGNGHGISLLGQPGFVNDQNLIAGNRIGTGPAGNSAIPNTVGIYLSGTVGPNDIGSPTAGGGNLISGNVDGVLAFGASETRVFGNSVGTNATGTAAVPNTGFGVRFLYGQFNDVGSDLPGSGNVISGNSGSAAVDIADESGSTVSGNLIGTRADGLTPLPNQTVFTVGICCSATGAQDVLIGGVTPTAGNTIAGNQASGASVRVMGEFSAVLGNRIGVGTDGITALASSGVAVLIDPATQNATIGDGISGNLIGNHSAAGVQVEGPGAFGTVIRGNAIGANSAGDPAGNGGAGVRINGADAVSVGEPGGLLTPVNQPLGFAPGNEIAHNGGPGVLVLGTSGHRISGNRIYNNTGIGIDLNGDGVSANDAGDVDTGANDTQNYPVLYGVTAVIGSFQYRGQLDALPSRSYRIEFYGANGQTLYGSTTVSTDANGFASFTQSFAAAPLPNPTTLSALAIDLSTGDTSEFAAAPGINLLAVAGDNQNTLVGAPFATPLTVRANDTRGNAVPRYAIDFQAIANAGATATLSAASATTNGTGVASITATANNVAGSHSVVANGQNGFGGPLNFSLNNTLAGLSIGPALISEGTGPATTLNFPISLSTPSATPVTVQATTVAGSAGANDYTPLSNQLVTIPPMTTSATLMVTVNAETLVEGDESFSVVLSNPSAPYVLATASATATILNDDSAVLNLSGPAPADEGNSGGVSIQGGPVPRIFTATLSAPVDVPVTVGFGTQDDTATAPSDYLTRGNVLEFAPGALSASTGVTVVPDRTPEPDERFFGVLSGLDAGGRPVTLGTTSAAAVLLNDDRPVRITIVDTPDPSLAGRPYQVQVSVAAEAPVIGTPAGTVQVSSGEDSCTITLAGGSGSCLLTDAMAGSKTLTATYIPPPGDLFFLGATATEPHQVLAPGVWVPIGPDGGDAVQVAIHPTDPRIAFAASPTALFRSSNGGASWTLAESGIPQSRGLVSFLGQERVPARWFSQCPGRPAWIYVAAVDGVARSVDTGLSFSPTALDTVATGDVAAVSCSPVNEQVVAVVIGTQIWRSLDSGLSWTQLTVPGPGTPVQVTQLADRTLIGVALPAPGTTLVYGVPLTGTAAVAEAALPQAASRVRAFVAAPASGQLYVQTDVATVRSPIGTALAWNPTVIPADAALAAAPDAAGRLLWSTTAGSSESGDFGASGTPISAAAQFDGALVRPLSLAVPAGFGPGNRSFLQGTAGTGPYRGERIAGGAAPRPSITGFQGVVAHAFAMSADTRQIVAGQARATTQAPNRTLHRSTDSGNAFAAAQAGYLPLNVDALAQQPGNPQLLLAAGDGAAAAVWRSVDGGSTWSASSSGLPATALLDGLRFHPAQPATVYAYGRAGSGARLWRSTDAGLNWSAADTGIAAGTPPLAVTDLGFDPVNPLVVYATTATLQRGPAPAGAAPALYRSTDGGQTWTALAGTGLPNNGAGRADLRAVLVDPAAPTRLWVSAYGLANDPTAAIPTAFGVYLSTDGGASFVQKLPQVQINDLVHFDPVTIGQEEPRIYAVSQPAAGLRADAFFTLANTGTNVIPGDVWDALSIGLPNLPIESLQVATSTSGPTEDVLLAGTRLGLYRLVLAEDRDLDGATTPTENGAPDNGGLPVGDGNGDGILDSNQVNVASAPVGSTSLLPSRGRSNYMTGGAGGANAIDVTATCSQFNNFVGIDADATFEPDLIAPSLRLKRRYAFGLVSFALPECSQAQVDIIFHDASFDPAFWRWRNYGPQTPGDSTTNRWYDFAGATLQPDGKTWRLLIDASQQGNWLADPNNILFYGGPAFVEPQQDYGDAPESYATLQEDDGARHLPVGPTLGATRDVEPNGQPSAAADADGADEDGVLLPTGEVLRGRDLAVTVQAPAGGQLSVWGDWNRNGRFDAGERVLSNQALTNGANPLNLPVPQNAALGASMLRFRLSQTAMPDPQPTGRWATGEVEDHAIVIGANGRYSVSVDGSGVVTEGDTGTRQLRFTVTRVGGVGPSSVQVFTSDVDTQAGEDYVPIFQTLDFPDAGSQSVVVEVNGELLVERNEQLDLWLQLPTAGAAIETESARGRIDNDDSAVLSVTGPAPIDEGNLGQTALLYPLTLDRPVDTAVSVRFATVNGSATAPEDYTAISDRLVVIPAGQTTANALVLVNGDLTVEPDETLGGQLSGLDAGGRNVTLSPTLIRGTTPLATIRNDDTRFVTRVLLTDTPDPSTIGQSWTLTATVQTVPPGPVPTGTVVVDDGSGPRTLALGGGSASTSYTDLSTGTRNLTAIYVPDSAEYLASQASATHTVGPAPTDVSLAGPAEARRGTPVRFDVTVGAPFGLQPTGSVTISSGTQSCTAPVADGGCSLTFASAGPRSVTAAYTSDNGNFLASSAKPVNHLAFNQADLGVIIDNGVTSYAAGDLLGYLIEVRNDGPDEASDTRLTVPVPPALLNPSWTCTGIGGAFCPQAGGTGPIDVQPALFPAGGRLRYVLNATVATPAPPQLTVTATITLPASRITQDPTPADLVASDTDGQQAIFGDGFEAGGPAALGVTGGIVPIELPLGRIAALPEGVPLRVATLRDVRGTALVVEAQQVDGRPRYRLTLRGADGLWQPGRWEPVPAARLDLLLTTVEQNGGLRITAVRARPGA